MPPHAVNKFWTDELRDIGEQCVRAVIKLLQHGVEPEWRDKFLRHFTDHVSSKPSLYADQRAEESFDENLKRIRGGHFEKIRLFGEESLRKASLDLTNDPNTCVLIDALDGSDLYEREMCNWCCAATFFTPQNQPGKQIRAAIVGLPNGTIYVAGDDEKPELDVFSRKGQKRELGGKSNVEHLADASICFYGQKVKNLVHTLQNPGWTSFLKSIESKDKKGSLTPRVYNLAGIPMIMKLIDRRMEDASSIDVVFDLIGQQAHDVVPGAFIAKRAGASVVHLDGKEISFNELEELIKKPNENKLKYIIASTPQLATEAAAVFGNAATA